MNLVKIIFYFKKKFKQILQEKFLKFYIILDIKNQTAKF
jgi:hypothetical protein